MNAERLKLAESSTRGSAPPAKAAVMTAFAVVAGMPGLTAGLEHTSQAAVSSIAHEIHGLHEYVMLFVAVLLVGVFGFMFYAVYAYRSSRDCKVDPFHKNAAVEIIWTVIPAIILVIIAWPAAGSLVAHHASSADITVADEVRSWWFPENGTTIGQDATTGSIRDTGLRVGAQGAYRGACVEPCVRENGFRLISTSVVGPPPCASWVIERAKVAATGGERVNATFGPHPLAPRVTKAGATDCVYGRQASGNDVPSAGC